MMIEISDPVVWKAIRDLDTCREALRLIAKHTNHWSGTVARKALESMNAKGEEDEP